MKKISLILFLLILFLAIFLRTYKLDTIPPGLFGDEVDVGYQAYSLGMTGKDLTGRFMPFYLKSLSEYRTPLYIYSAVPFVMAFGLNEWGVRLPAVFWGIISVIGIFLLARKLFGEKVGLFSMFLMTISPWNLQYSRASFEVTMLISFMIFGVYFFLLGLNKARYYFLAIILLVSSIYIYSTAVVFAPLLILLLLIIYWKEVRKTNLKNLFFIVLVAMVLLLPVGFSMITGEAKERFNSISIFQNSVLVDKINLSRKGEQFTSTDGQIEKTNPQFEALFINKPLIFAQVFFNNYFKALSPTFLFTDGDINFRQSIHEMGEEYYFEIFLLLLGIFALIKTNAKKIALVLGWLLLAPISGSMTFDGGFHATRLILMLPPLILLSGNGAVWILDNWKYWFGKIFALIVIILFIFNFSFYLHRYYVHYAPESWRWWHVGFKEAMQYMKNEGTNYKMVGFNNTYEPSLIRFLFWNKVDPAEFQKYQGKLDTKEIFPGYKGLAVNDKYFFGSGDKQIQDILPAGTLYMVSARDEVPGDWDWSKTPPPGIKVLKAVRDPSGAAIFYVVTKE